MNRIIEIIKRFREYVIFTALVIVSLVLMSFGDFSHAGGFRALIVGSVGWLQDIADLSPNNRLLEMENRTIRQLNLENSSQITRMRKATIENHTLRQMVDLGEDVSYDHITAMVVGNTKIALRDYLTMNKGIADSITDGMCAINDAGLIGIVSGVSKHYCLVEMIINRDIEIAAKVQSTRVNGILKWAGGNSFSLDYLLKSQNVALGDTILTSNYSNKYPADIPVGTVVEVTEKPGDMYLHVMVKPFVDFHRLEIAFLLRHIPDPERINLIREMNRKLEARNIRVKR